MPPRRREANMKRMGLGWVVLASLLLASPAFAALDQDWTQIAFGEISRIGMDRSGDDLYFVWDDFGADQILFLRLGDPQPTVISTGVFSRFPTVHAHNDDVHVVWEQGQRLHVRTSRDRGASFGPAVEVSGPFRGGLSAVATSGGRLYVAWEFTIEDELGGVALVVSKDRGASFSPALRLDEDSGHGETRIAAHGNGVHVFWDDNFKNEDPRARIRTSRNHGKSFGPMTVLSPHPLDWPAAAVGHVFAHGNRVFLNWSQDDRDFGPPPIFRTHHFARSLDHGGSFESTVIATGDSSVLGPARMDAAKKHIAYVWEVHAFGDFFAPSELLLRESMDGGATFGPAIDITESPATWSKLLGMGVDEEKTHLFWREALPAPGGFQWFRGMTIEGGVPGPFVHLMDDTIDVEEADLMAKEGHIDLYALEWTPTGYRLLYRHGMDSLH